MLGYAVCPAKLEVSAVSYSLFGSSTTSFYTVSLVCTARVAIYATCVN